MDAMEKMQLHEAYIPPVIGVGNTVLFKRRHRTVWELGTVYPPQNVSWKPGDPVGKQISICVWAGQPACKIEENCVHIKDPLYIYDDQRQRSCWEAVSAVTPDALLTVFTELQSKMQIAEAEMAETKQHLNNTMTELARLSAQISSTKQQRRKPQPGEEVLTDAA